MIPPTILAMYTRITKRCIRFSAVIGHVHLCSSSFFTSCFLLVALWSCVSASFSLFLPVSVNFTVFSQHVDICFAVALLEYSFLGLSVSRFHRGLLNSHTVFIKLFPRYEYSRMHFDPCIELGSVLVHYAL